YGPVLLPPLTPQEPRRYDPQGAKLRPLVLNNMARPEPLLPECLVFPPRSAGFLRLCHPKRYAPNHEEHLLRPATSPNFGVLTFRLIPKRSVPLQYDCAQSRRATRHAIASRLIRAYH